MDELNPKNLESFDKIETALKEKQAVKQALQKRS